MRRWLWFSIAILLLLNAILHPSTVGLACLCIWFFLPIASWGLAWPARRQVHLQLDAPSVAEKGTSFPLTVRCTHGLCPCGPVSFYLHVENSVTNEQAQTKVVVQQTQTLTLSGEFCGCLRCSVQKARLWDFCGILPVPLADAGMQKILVMPHTFPVAICEEAAEAPSEDCQEYAPDKKGQDRTETYQLREYAPGDDLRQIHWKLSGKRAHLLVREASYPIEHSVMLFVNRSMQEASAAQKDAVLEAAVSISQALAENGQSFSLCWNEETIRIQSVQEQNALPDAISALLCAKPCSEEDGTSLYLRTLGAPVVGRLIYLGTQMPEEEFVQTACCKIWICRKNMTASHAAQALRILSWS